MASLGSRNVYCLFPGGVMVRSGSPRAPGMVWNYGGIYFCLVFFFVFSFVAILLINYLLCAFSFQDKISTENFGLI